MSVITRMKVTHNEPSASMTDLIVKVGARNTLNAVARWFEAMVNGSRNGSVLLSVAEASGVAASGTVTLSSGSGTETATINGVAIAITWATSDTNSASLLAAAINASANALVSGLVTATSAAGVVTITAVEKGKTGNMCTLTASGTGATASGTGRLTGGVDIVYTTYDKS
jgi:phage tail sheath gpL-like